MLVNNKNNNINNWLGDASLSLKLFYAIARNETLGFQFWRHGYWADHLRGKPYHISALYVVDLQKFRCIYGADECVRV